MNVSDINMDDLEKFKNEKTPDKHKDSTPEQMQESISKLADKFNRK